MELVIAIAIGVMGGAGAWLVLRPRTFQVLIGLSLLSYAVNLFIFSVGSLAVDAEPIVRAGVPADLAPVVETIRAVATELAGKSTKLEFAEVDPTGNQALQAELATVTSQLNGLLGEGKKKAAETFVDAAIREGRVGVKPMRDRYVALDLMDDLGLLDGWAELAVTRAERITFVTQVRHHVHLAAFALVKDRPGDVEYHLTQLVRLAVREEARARATVDDGPTPVRRAA